MQRNANLAGNRDALPKTYNSFTISKHLHLHISQQRLVKSLIFNNILIRDQEAGGSNPLAPTILFKQTELFPSPHIRPSGLSPGALLKNFFERRLRFRTRPMALATTRLEISG
jgi:hypothetical protein